MPVLPRPQTSGPVVAVEIGQPDRPVKGVSIPINSPRSSAAAETSRRASTTVLRQTGIISIGYEIPW
jgi:hypothetical protein